MLEKNRETSGQAAHGKLKKRLLAIFMLALLLMGVFTCTSYGSEASVSIQTSSITVGDTSTVTITYTGSSLGRVIAALEYDNTVISYLGGGDSEGDNGFVSINRASDDGKTIVVSLKFQGISEGNATLYLTTREVYDLYEAAMTVSDTQQKLTVTAKVEEAVATQDQEETVDTAASAESTEATEDTEATEEEGIQEQDTVSQETPHTLVLLGALAGVILLALIITLVVRKNKKKAAEELSEGTSSDSPEESSL